MLAGDGGTELRPRGRGPPCEAVAVVAAVGLLEPSWLACDDGGCTGVALAPARSTGDSPLAGVPWLPCFCSVAEVLCCSGTSSMDTTCLLTADAGTSVRHAGTSRVRHCSTTACVASHARIASTKCCCVRGCMARGCSAPLLPPHRGDGTWPAPPACDQLKDPGDRGVAARLAPLRPAAAVAAPTRRVSRCRSAAGGSGVLGAALARPMLPLLMTRCKPDATNGEWSPATAWLVPAGATGTSGSNPA